MRATRNAEAAIVWLWDHKHSGKQAGLASLKLPSLSLAACSLVFVTQQAKAFLTVTEPPNVSPQQPLEFLYPFENLGAMGEGDKYEQNRLHDILEEIIKVF